MCVYNTCTCVQESCLGGAGCPHVQTCRHTLYLLPSLAELYTRYIHIIGVSFSLYCTVDAVSCSSLVSTGYIFFVFSCSRRSRRFESVCLPYRNLPSQYHTTFCHEQKVQVGCDVYVLLVYCTCTSVAVVFFAGFCVTSKKSYKLDMCTYYDTCTLYMYE